MSQLYGGYWDGFSTTNGRLLVGRAGVLANNLTRWSLTEPKYIRPTGEEGFILLGPWVTLPAGYYEARYLIEILYGNSEDSIIRFEVYAQGTVFTSEEFNLVEIGTGIHELSVFFHLNNETEHVEWRAYVMENVALRLTRTTLYKHNFIYE